MNRRAIIHALVLGLGVALWVCLDPWISVALSIDYYPFFLSSVLAGLLMVGLIFSFQLNTLWQDKERWAVLFAVIMTQFSGISLGKIDLLEFATFLLVVFWLLQAFVEADRTIQTTPVFFLILGLLLFSTLALINRPSWMSFISIGEKFILFLILVDLIRRRLTIRTIGRAVIWAGLFSSLVGIAQFILYMEWGYLLTIGAPGDDPRSFLKPTPFGMLPRATGFFPNPAGLNDFLLFSAAIVLFALASARTWKLKAAYAGAFLVMSSAIVLTWSTTSLMALALLLVIFFYVNRPALSIHYSAGILLMVIISYEIGLLGLAYKFVESSGGSAGKIRVELLGLGLKSLLESPVIGVGVQNFQSVSGNYFPEGPYIFKYPVHNAFFQMATELGIFGGLIFLGLVVFFTIRLGMVLAARPNEEQWLFKGFLLGWIGIVIHMMSEPMAYEGTLWLIFGLIEGACLTMLKRGGEAPGEERRDLPLLASTS